jgi:hypothetical protein
LEIKSSCGPDKNQVHGLSLSLQTKILSVNLKLNSSSGCSYLCFFEIDGGVDYILVLMKSVPHNENGILPKLGIIECRQL